MTKEFVVCVLVFLTLCAALLFAGFRAGQVYEAVHTEPQKVLPLNLEQIEARCESKVTEAWKEAQNALDQAHPGWRLRGCYYKSDEDIDP